MNSQLLVDKIKTDQQQHILDYKWLIRIYLSQNGLVNQYLKTTDPSKIDDRINQSRSQTEHRSLNQIKHDPFTILLEASVSSFKYLAKYQKQIQNDTSLRVMTQMCNQPNLVNDIDFEDQQQSDLAQIFNQMSLSTRSLDLCYDCGTVARGLFFTLIQAHRGQFSITPEEILRLRRDYRMDRYTPQEAIDVLNHNCHKIQSNCLFLCALQFGNDKFGHIYIIEKTYMKSKSKSKSQQPRYRLFQSCFNSYLLIDEIEYCDYANPQSSIDIHKHLQDLQILLTTPTWNADIIALFCDWFHFYPTSRILASDIKLFTSAYIIY